MIPGGGGSEENGASVVTAGEAGVQKKTTTARVKKRAAKGDEKKVKALSAKKKKKKPALGVFAAPTDEGGDGAKRCLFPDGAVGGEADAVPPPSREMTNHLASREGRQAALANLWPAADAIPQLRVQGLVAPLPGSVLSGAWVRVMAQDCEERNTADSSISEAIPKSHCPICALHARMRVTECLFNSLQCLIIEIGLVDGVNKILASANVRYQIKLEKSEGGVAKYKACSLNGAPASNLIQCAPIIIEYVFDNINVEADEPDLSPDDVKLALKVAFKDLWKQWGVVDEAMSALIPCPEMIDDFGKNVAKLAILWNGDLPFSCLLCFQPV